ncbi:MAG: hypothetical protein J5494_01585 [Candidatus Methanomethylophilaceae archaeon]|nr:hypothetical protein [Candidatus Methanomethylophilaceae archaeon]
MKTTKKQLKEMREQFGIAKALFERLEKRGVMERNEKVWELWNMVWEPLNSFLYSDKTEWPENIDLWTEAAQTALRVYKATLTVFADRDAVVKANLGSVA